MRQLKLYRVDNDYIRFLQRFQEHIFNNKYDGYARPYVGVVLEIENYKYYIPLSSPKPKHRKMKDGIDFKKVFVRGRLIAVMNLNNMIPVSDTLIELIDIANEEVNYQNLLNAEIAYIRGKKDIIIRDARILYNIVVNNLEGNDKLISRCFDFELLENKLDDYNNNES